MQERYEDFAAVFKPAMKGKKRGPRTNKGQAGQGWRDGAGRSQGREGKETGTPVAVVAEDKSPKESWLVPASVFMGA